MIGRNGGIGGISRIILQRVVPLIKLGSSVIRSTSPRPVSGSKIGPKREPGPARSPEARDADLGPIPHFHPEKHPLHSRNGARASGSPSSVSRNVELGFAIEAEGERSFLRFLLFSPALSSPPSLVRSTADSFPCKSSHCAVAAMSKRGSRSKQWFGVCKLSVPALVTYAALIVLALVLFYWGGGKKPVPVPVPAHVKQRWDRFDSLVQFHPVVELRNGTDLISQIPDSPKAVLFIAHGCNGRAINFWDRSPTCQQCVGLPEERLLVLEGLSRKFAVLTVSSVGRCWTMGEERLIVRDIIRWWVGKNKLEKLPLVALGASSGGYFVSALATNLRFSSIVLMIAEGIFDQMDVPEDYPPTLFVQMPKDTIRQQKIDEFMPDLKSKGIDVAAVECVEFPLSASTLADRIPGVDENVSAKLFELFRSKGFVDANGYMKRDGRAVRWKKALKENKNILLDRQLVNHVQEELNLAFAYHEMTSLQSEQIFKWFESHMS